MTLIVVITVAITLALASRSREVERPPSRQEFQDYLDRMADRGRR
ncbi:MAG TPA: hypothetical protein VNT51_02200 [Miltoncostaeaceae bacterium]|jgi:uncharacterized protein (DUF2236 family)|nr:hypothetical protein [Miltoncostaeaceae bacterium]